MTTDGNLLYTTLKLIKIDITIDVRTMEDALTTSARWFVDEKLHADLPGSKDNRTRERLER